MCSPPTQDQQLRMRRDTDGKEIAGWTQLEVGAKDRFYQRRILVALLLKLCEKNEDKCDQN